MATVMATFGPFSGRWLELVARRARLSDKRAKFATHYKIVSAVARKTFVETLTVGEVFDGADFCRRYT